MTGSPELSPEVKASFDQMYAKRLRAWVRKSNRWFSIYSTEEHWNPRRMPSKNSKHQAYADGAQLARLRGVEVPHSYKALCDLVGEPDLRPLGLIAAPAVGEERA